MNNMLRIFSLYLLFFISIFLKGNSAQVQQIFINAHCNNTIEACKKFDYCGATEQCACNTIDNLIDLLNNRSINSDLTELNIYISQGLYVISNGLLFGNISNVNIQYKNFSCEHQITSPHDKSYGSIKQNISNTVSTSIAAINKLNYKQTEIAKATNAYCNEQYYLNHTLLRTLSNEETQHAKPTPVVNNNTYEVIILPVINPSILATTQGIFIFTYNFTINGITIFGSKSQILFQNAIDIYEDHNDGKDNDAKNRKIHISVDITNFNIFYTTLFYTSDSLITTRSTTTISSAMIFNNMYASSLIVITSNTVGTIEKALFNEVFIANTKNTERICLLQSATTSIQHSIFFNNHATITAHLSAVKMNYVLLLQSIDTAIATTSSSVTIANSLLAGCSGYQGAVLSAENGAIITIHNSLVTGNTAELQGTFFLAGSTRFEYTAVVSDTCITNNAATAGGAFYLNVNAAVVEFNNTYAAENIAQNGGVIQYMGNYGTVVARNSYFVKNTAVMGASIAAYFQFVHVHISNCYFTNQGLAASVIIKTEIYSVNSITIENSQIFQYTSAYGLLASSDITLVNTTFHSIRIASSLEAEFVGPVYALEHLLVQNCEVTEVTTLNGFILGSKDTTIRIENSMFNDITALERGAVANTDGEVYISNSNITYAHSLSAGAIYCANLFMEQTVLAFCTSNDGIVIISGATKVNISSSAFLSNLATEAPALHIKQGTGLQRAEVTIENSTFSGNNLRQNAFYAGYKGNILIDPPQKIAKCSVNWPVTTIRVQLVVVHLRNCSFNRIQQLNLIHAIVPVEVKPAFLPQHFNLTLKPVDYCGADVQSAVTQIPANISCVGCKTSLKATFTLNGKYLTLYEPSLVKAAEYEVTYSYKFTRVAKAEIVPGVISANNSRYSVTSATYFKYCYNATPTVHVITADYFNNLCPCKSAYVNLTIRSEGPVSQSISMQQPNVNPLSLQSSVAEIGNYSLYISFNASPRPVFGSPFQLNIEQGEVACGRSKLNISTQTLIAGNSITITLYLQNTANLPIVVPDVLHCSRLSLVITSENNIAVPYTLPIDQFTLQNASSFVLTTNVSQAGNAKVYYAFQSKACLSSSYFQVFPAAMSEEMSSTNITSSQSVKARDTFVVLVRYNDMYSNPLNACDFKSVTNLTSSVPIPGSKVTITCNYPTYGKSLLLLSTKRTSIGKYKLSVTVDKILISNSDFSLQITGLTGAQLTELWIVIALVGIVAILLLAMVAMIIFYFKQKRKLLRSVPLLQPLDKQFSKLSHEHLIQSLDELLADSSIEQIPFERLEIVKKIGVGASGLVSKAMWKCEDALTNRTVKLEVAVKELHSSTLVIETDLADFVSEISLASKLHHPNIVRFIGISVGQNVMLVTEYMQYGSLADALTKQHDELQAKHRIKIMMDCAQGMAYLHKRNIIHRDLKPANILLGELCTGKITDFGISTIKPDRTMTMTLIGSPAYMAPEILESQTYNESVDVYAFGIVFWQTLTGEWPYYNEAKPNMVNLPHAICNGLRPDISNFPPITAKLTSACWSGNAKLRPRFNEIIEILHKLAYIEEELEAIQRNLDVKSIASQKKEQE